MGLQIQVFSVFKRNLAMQPSGVSIYNNANY